jgi:hypothetical protein
MMQVLVKLIRWWKGEEKVRKRRKCELLVSSFYSCFVCSILERLFLMVLMVMEECE